MNQIRVSPRGTRGVRIPRGGPLMALFRFFTKRTIQSYRRSGGAGISIRMGFPVVLLTTRGAKTSQERTTPLGGFKEGAEAWLIVASLAGAARHPAWFLNMAAHPDDVWLEVGKERSKVRAETLDGEDRIQALHRIAAISARYGGYQEKTDREIPIVRLTRED
jgi:deazaflavin-dependent oxidoreductase (nitroreductase family)